MIKIAQLANKLDSVGMAKEADCLDSLLPEIISFQKKLSYLNTENVKTYANNSLGLIRLGSKIDETLRSINTEESISLANEIKIAGIGDWFSGMAEIVKSPFSSSGKFFADLAQGGRLKSSLDKSLKNLSKIRPLIEKGEEQGLKQAQAMIQEDIASLSSILKDAYGDLTFFDNDIKNKDKNKEQNQDPEADKMKQRILDSFEDTGNSGPVSGEMSDSTIQDILTKSQSKNGLMNKYSQNQGALALINDLAQLGYAVKNTKNLQMAFNAWVAVLSSLNKVQHDRRAEPRHNSMNPDINDPSRGGGFSPGTRENKPPVNVESIPTTFTETETLKKLTNSVTFNGAVKNFMKQFADRNFSLSQSEELVEAARRK